MEILDEALKMLTEYPLCDHCLGRQFALLGYGAENKNRGQALKLLLTMKGHQLMLSQNKMGVATLKAVAVNGSFEMAQRLLTRFKVYGQEGRPCFLCDGKFSKINTLVDKIIVKLKTYEYTSFLIGIEIPLKIAEREDELKARFDVTHGESMKNQFSRDIGKRVCGITDKDVDFATPNIVVLINPFTNHIRLQVNPLFIAGRYRKLVRGIPQSRWLCSRCEGKGCKSCNWTGKKYQESVEELIASPTIKMTDGKETVFHGAGREDVDVRMLGSGRPFVLEVKYPKKRFIDLRKLEQAINQHAEGRVDVHKLTFADKNVARKLKKADAAKVYRAIVEFDRAVSDEELNRIAKTLSCSTVLQRTPKRVLHRRANLVREKYIYKTKVKRESHNRAEMQIHCQGGLYIKELISGDEDRTAPSVAGIVDSVASPSQLDVLSVVMREEQ